MRHHDHKSQHFLRVVEELEELLSFFRTAGTAEYDELIVQGEKDLERARTLREEGHSGARYRLEWALRPLRAQRASLTKLRPLAEVARIEGLTPGHLHNQVASGELRITPVDGIRKISLLEFRRQRGKAASASEPPAEPEPATAPHRPTFPDGGGPKPLNIHAVS